MLNPEDFIFFYWTGFTPVPSAGATGQAGLTGFIVALPASG